MRPLFLWIFIFLAGCGSATSEDFASAPANASENISALSTADPTEATTDKEWFRIVVLDVGQGDATLLIAPTGETALIDTGPPEKGPPAVAAAMQEMDLKKIDTIFISHHHLDHIGGLKDILEKPWASSAKVIDKTDAMVGSTIHVGNVVVHIEAANARIGNNTPPPNSQADENNLSLALLIEFGQFRYFTDGDLPGGGGSPPYQTIDLETPLAPLIGDIDVMLVPHHGSHTSSNANFLSVLKPKVAILSVGNDNDYYHPHPSTISHLKKIGAKIFQTERGSLKNREGVEVVGGSICILSDGVDYFVKAYAVDKCAPGPVE